MEYPLVTVIIPAYNAEPFIKKGINSVLNQTYKHIELIIVDDGSKDNTSNIIINNYSNCNNIKLIKQKNLGVSVARNKGLEFSSGDYCVFLDADDWLEENCIETLLSLSETNNNTFIVCDRFEVKYKDNKYVKNNLSKMTSREEHEVSEAIIHFTKYNMQSACYKLFNLSLIKKFNIKFPEGLSHGEDGLFVFRYLQHVDKFIYVSKPMWNILDNPNSATMAEFNSSMLTGIIAYEKMLEENEKYNCEEINQALYDLILMRIVSFAIKGMLSSKTTNYDKLYFKYKLKYYLRLIRYKNTFNKVIILSLLYLFTPTILKQIIMFKKYIDKQKNYFDN